MSLIEFVESLILDLIQRKQARSPRISPLVDKPSGVLLGESWPLDSFRFGVGDPLSVASSELRRHLYVLGATGCGKTNLLVQLVDHDVAVGRSVVLIDLRGDLVERILNRIAHQQIDPTRLCLLDLRDDQNVTPFNPLSGSGEIHSKAFHVLGVLRQQSESWGVQLEETLRNSLVALTEAGGSLVDLEALLLDDRQRALLLSDSTDPLAASFFRRYGELSKERRLAWALPVLNKVTPLLAIPRIRSMLAGPASIDLNGVINTNGSILLVSLAVDRFHAASNLIGGMLVSAIRGTVMARAAIPEHLRNPVSMYVDEFETMASDAFQEILAEGRRFGLSLVLSHQNLSQLSSRLKVGLQTNAHLHLYFQTGAADAGEIVKEIVCDVPRDDLRLLLMSLQTGEAAFVRRGEESLGVVTPLSRDPRVSKACLDALKQASYAHWLPTVPPSPKASFPGILTPSTTQWEVRDDH